MATIKDMIAPFDLLQPTTVEGAVELLEEHGSEAWVLAGGLDSFDWFKDRIKRPRVVVDLGAITELITFDVYNWGGLMAGAMLGSLPVAILYSFFVDHYVSSMTGAVKE